MEMTQTQKTLIGLTQSELESFSSALDQPPYRGRQLAHWLYQRNAQSFAEMSDLSVALREELATRAQIGSLTVAHRTPSEADGTQKFLYELSDGLRIESVYLPESPGTTICISSQVGCAMGCKFCATGKMGYYRNLTAGEMVLQVLETQRSTDSKITNIVFMGMGEPLHNYENVVRALEIFTAQWGLGLSPSRLTVSTVGIAPMVERWCAENPPAKLALSLHATTDDQREKIVPSAKAFPLETLMKSMRRYAHVTRWPVTFEYIMIADFNDAREDANRLRQLTRNIPVKVNLIRLHPTGGDLRSSSDEAIHRFMGWLVEEGITCTLRESRGVADSAACGMLFTQEPFRPTKAHAWEKPVET
jgi:23S rRNA (adenine2503-C2)-methyltransferase